ncbi:TIR domain-containing protein [Aliarcobacter butzleri]|uniref:TIR domain-containing protein n=1 Tax=Aliarcobacter butzleri TaxID=28197 RepID=UPI001EDC04D4|nr:nucleotide-binding protein [Aliarcobacter butzleri]MCG3658616.1 nucleotide-binding protein [Aliarcobacter butzleri]
MTKTEALEKLNTLLNELSDLPDFIYNGDNSKFDKWYRKAGRYIKEIFKNQNERSTEFSEIEFTYNHLIITDETDFKNDSTKAHHRGRKDAKTLLESFIEEVEEWKDDNTTIADTFAQTAQINTSNKVFIVHGHDNGAKHEVARFLINLGLEPIILHEQASSQKTIIEKIESYAGQVGFGVVLYTACDIGGKDKDNLQSRARQNVVFEHGYLIGLLGRDRVCPLVKGHIETPGDISGIVYTPMDDAGSWHLPLAKELRAAGYIIDPSKLF